MTKVCFHRRESFRICYHPSQYLPYPHRRYCDDSWEALERPVADTASTRRRHSFKNGLILDRKTTYFNIVFVITPHKSNTPVCLS